MISSFSKYTRDCEKYANMRKIDQVSDVCVPEAHILQMEEDELVICRRLQVFPLSVFVGKDHMFLEYNTSTVTPLY